MNSVREQLYAALEERDDALSILLDQLTEKQMAATRAMLAN